MQKLSAAVLVGVLALGTAACDNFLDVNKNPNAPETVAANLYLAPMIHNWVTGQQLDGRYIGRMTQQWVLPQASGGTPSNWERHGYDRGSDTGGEQWRNVYWQFGLNLRDMMQKAEAEERWDLLGIGYLLKGWGWLALTTVHGEIIIQEAFTPDKYYFNYDTQEYAYTEALRLLDEAIKNLERTDGNISASYIAVGDKMYNGDRTKWLKLAWGIKAMALNHYSNKGALYKPADVIAAVDKSFTGPADDALFLYSNVSTTVSDDRNFWGTSRANNTYRQSAWLVSLMDGTLFPGAPDPRMKRMLAPSPDSVWRGVDPMVGFSTNLNQRPNNIHGYAGSGGAGLPGRYIFDDKVRFPFMTYFQLQFIKAEAAYKAGNLALAREAYLNALSAHIDFVNARNQETANTALTVVPITAAEKAAFLSNPSIAPNPITLSHIMSQKFIAQYGWAHNELWMDMRRYHYTEMDPAAGTQVFRGHTPVTNLDPDNGGKLAYRIRPRYNSEYVWNRQSLDKFGGLALDFHTKEMWITQR